MSRGATRRVSGSGESREFSVVRQAARSACLIAIVVALVAFVLAAPLGAAAPRPHRHAGSQGGGLGNPSSDSTAPQIPPGATVPAVRAWIERAISLRLAALRGADAAAVARAALTANDRSLLVALISTDRSGLDTLAAGVRSDVGTTQLQDAIDTMITVYRVFSVVVPQVQVAIEIDANDVVVARLARTEAEISAAVTTASALGNPRATERAYSALVSSVQAASGLLQSAHSAVLGAVPLAYPGSAQVFASAQTAIASARTDISAARSDIEEIAQLLRKRLGTTTLTIP